MATIGKDPGGRRRVLFVGPDGKRYTVRLGKCAQRDADSFKLRVEALLSAKLRNTPPDQDSPPLPASDRSRL